MVLFIEDHLPWAEHLRIPKNQTLYLQFILQIRLYLGIGPTLIRLLALERPLFLPFLQSALLHDFMQEEVSQIFGELSIIFVRHEFRSTVILLYFLGLASYLFSDV